MTSRRTTRLELSVAPGLEARAPRRQDLRRWVAAALTEAGVGGVVSIRVMGEAEMRALNATWRGRDATTNVLSFPADRSAVEATGLLGDLALCVPVVEQEAVEQGKEVPAHFAHLVVHGVLHLLGFDHERDDEARLMEAKEIEILDRLGVADPYCMRPRRP